jgi:hypothetical protein
MPIQIMYVVLSCSFATIIKRQASLQHNVERNSKTPNIHSLAWIFFKLYHLWRNVWRWPTKCLQKIVIMGLKHFCQPKIYEFCIKISINYNILSLNVSMSNIKLMQVLNCTNNLVKNFSCTNLGQWPKSIQMIEKLLSFDKLHENINWFLSPYGLVEFDNIGMV